MGHWVEVAALDGSGSFKAFEAGEGKAGIVVIQEIFGVNPGIRAQVEEWAALGYTAIAPDLFWRMKPGVELNADINEEMQQAFGYYQKFDVDKAIADIEASIKLLRSKGCSKVGTIGYCLGGLLAYLTATRTDTDAAVGYYGVGIDERLHEANAIGKPLMLHIATKDGFVPPEKQAKVREGLAGHRHVTIHDYHADHAFARYSGLARVEHLAVEADGRTREFFKQHLG